MSDIAQQSLRSAIAVLDDDKKPNQAVRFYRRKLKVIQSALHHLRALEITALIETCEDCEGTLIIPTNHDPRDPQYGERCVRCEELMKLSEEIA